MGGLQVCIKVACNLYLMGWGLEENKRFFSRRQRHLSRICTACLAGVRKRLNLVLASLGQMTSRETL